VNYRLNENKITKKYEIINLTSKVVVRVFDKKSLALTFLKIVNDPHYGRGGSIASVS
jgi:hypothetical protein